MRKSFGFIALVFLATSCGMLKGSKKMKPRDGVVFYAKEYMGTPYRLGGNNHKGLLIARKYFSQNNTKETSIAQAWV